MLTHSAILTALKPVHTIVVPVLQGDTFIYFLAPGVTSDSAAREYKDFVPARDYFPGSGLRGFMYIGHWYSVSESSIDRSWRTGRLRNFNPAEIRKLNNLIRNSYSTSSAIKSDLKT